MSAHNARINAGASSEWDLVMTREFDAPRELAFKAWTDARQVAQWWGPKGFANPVCELDVRVGGAIRIHMRAPNGVVYPMTGVFQEIDEPERLVFVSSALDDQGKSMFDIRNVVSFVEQHGKTVLTLQARVISATAQAPQYLQGMEMGWAQTLDRLGAYLQSTTGGRAKG
ncbi:MAG TPA: SRPBCC domain-containing protein [Candidatus Sulfotelmatobacter sp.]|nr:SRPBCC domain-containing protein [Candidatus Sulfotelmatobacter sp.]